MYEQFAGSATDTPHFQLNPNHACTPLPCADCHPDSFRPVFAKVTVAWKVLVCMHNLIQVRQTAKRKHDEKNDIYPSLSTPCRLFLTLIWLLLCVCACVRCVCRRGIQRATSPTDSTTFMWGSRSTRAKARSVCLGQPRPARALFSLFSLSCPLSCLSAWCTVNLSVSCVSVCVCVLSLFFVLPRLYVWWACICTCLCLVCSFRLSWWSFLSG